MRFLPGAIAALLVAVPAVAQQPAPADSVQPILTTSETAPAGPVANLSLDEALSLAGRNNPAFLQTANNDRVANAAVRSAYGAWLPSVSTSLGAGFRQGRQQFFAGEAVGAATDQISSSYSLDAQASYSVATVLAPRQQRAQANAVDGDIRAARMALRSDVTRQYLQVLAEDARAALQDTLLRTAEVQLELAKIRQQVGSATMLDVQRAEVQLGQQRVARVRARASAESERARLFQLMGVPAPGAVRLTTAFPVEPLTFSLDQLLGMSRSENPGLAAARLRERAADVNVSATRGLYAPSLNLSASWGGYTNQFTDDNALLGQATASKQSSCFQEAQIRSIVGQPSDPDACRAIVLTDAEANAVRAGNRAFPFDFTTSPYQLNASLSLPLFNGLNREQRVQEAAVQRADARYATRAAELQVATDVQLAYVALQAAYEAAQIQEQNVQTARQALELAQERYRVGANTFVEVSQARDDFQRTVQERIGAVAEYHRAYAALETAVGRPLR
ncbi:MAG TPA: TolC family protein [Gemmatimonadaceae bacterium]|nr:TolC family protein [Gemmatimonadaceae bacterium]